MSPLRLRPFDGLRGRLYPDDAEIGDLPVLLLVYLGFLLLPIALPRLAHVSWWPTVIALLAFLPLYFWGWWRPRMLPVLALLIAALAFALTPSNPGASTFIVYALAQAADIRSLKWALAMLAGIVGTYSLLLWWIEFPAVVMLAAVIPGIAVFFGNRSFREMHRRRAMLRLSQEEIRRLSERAERERIARDLHDLLGHTLSLIALKAELARKLAHKSVERAADEMQQVEQLARSSLDEVRLALHDMRRATLDPEFAQARLVMEAAGIRLQLERADIVLDPPCEAALALALREATTNIVRHAKASEVRVGVRVEQRWVVMEVVDNGRGGLDEAGVSESGNGLRGMRERLDACGGGMQIESVRGTGTRLRIQVPRPQRSAAVLPAALAQTESPA